MRTAPVDFDRLEFVDVSKNYGRRRALARVSLTGAAGEILGLFGPNGAGKSTLLSIASTLVAPTSGAVHYGGRPAGAHGDRLRASIGVLGHDLFLYQDLTAAENLEFFARLSGVGDVASRVREGLRQARLEERADDRAGTFSRGLRQRLALERALIHGPRLVLLDEPFTGLDDDSARVLGDRLRALRRDGAIVVMATHDFDTAEGLVDRAVCLVQGRLREIAAGTRSLRDRYRDAVRAEAAA